MIPASHPRAFSLHTRDQIVEGLKKGMTSIHGLIAHGRGEAFDYLLGEKTHPFAWEAIHAAATMLNAAQHPVLSINGNVAALCSKEMIQLAALLDAPIEINLFHASKKREKMIARHLLSLGAKKILLPDRGMIPFIDHNRKYCNQDGIENADVVFVPLEDGDRCQALQKMRKKIITVDLNPLSRTAQAAHITIVDNILRALPLLVEEVRRKNTPTQYNNKKILKNAITLMRSRV